MVSCGRNISFDSQYILGNESLEKVDKIEDLGVTFDKSLKFKEHISEKIFKAYSVIGIIKRNFMHLSEISSFLYGHHTETAYSGCDLIIALYNIQNDISERCRKFRFIIPITESIFTQKYVS